MRCFLFRGLLSSRHDALRLVLVHEDAAGLDGSGCSQHDVAVLERREFDHDGPVSVLSRERMGVLQQFALNDLSRACSASEFRLDTPRPTRHRK